MDETASETYTIRRNALNDRILKAAAIRVQSLLNRGDPAYVVCKRIVDDISTISPSDACWKDDDPVDEAVAEIHSRIQAALDRLDVEQVEKISIRCKKPVAKPWNGTAAEVIEKAGLNRSGQRSQRSRRVSRVVTSTRG